MAPQTDTTKGNKSDITLITVMSKLEDISHDISTLKQNQNSFSRSLDFMSDKFENLLSRTSELEKANKELKQANSELRNRIDILESDVSQQNQYSRRSNLEISGIPERADENTDDIVLSVLQKIHPSVEITDIDITHRIGRVPDNDRDPSRSNQHRPIIVAFTNRRIRNSIYDQRRKLKGFSTKNLGYSTANSIFVNENLCPATRQLLGKVNISRKKSGYRYLWTHNGKIYIKKDQQARSIAITREDDIAKYCAK
ncbi:uncharacterized protein [Ptychodera flava]|uniref:uncharacterized protein n=1 Tax=Ptychodera flava TaxID=63121 RepID=UPI003969CDE1